MKLLHLERDIYPTDSLNQLERLFEVDYLPINCDQKTMIGQLQRKQYDVIFTRLGVELGGDEMELCPQLKAIVTPTTGLNHIDVTAAENSGVEVISLKGEVDFLNQITSTAEHNWGLLLALVRNLRSSTSDVRAGNWRRKPFLAFDLYQKTIGIIGYGRLGKIVGRYAHAFGMKVLAFDIREEAFHGCPQWVGRSNLQDLLIRSDAITLHIPYNRHNDGFFNAELFAQLARKPFFINTSRGEVVEEGALLKALQTGRIAAAGIDVLNGDSAWAGTSPVGHPLVAYAKEHNNLLITPHMGGYGDNSIYNTRAFITSKFLNSLK